MKNNMTDIKEVTKHYYRITTKPYCSVFLDEYLMKKANKILYKYFLEMSELLENNQQHLIKQDWALAYPNKEQVSFYSAEPVDGYTTFLPRFETTLVKNIFDIQGQNIYSEEVKKEVEKLLEKKGTYERIPRGKTKREPSPSGLLAQ